MERDWTRLDDGSMLLEGRRIVESWSAIESRWTLISAGQTRESMYRLRLYTATEMSLMPREAGVSTVNVCGSLEGIGDDQDTRRLVVVAER
ncbi:unnamed protein product [marine sediment metagenome]|uniref:Uncharacterized protein n=1 Tax=marine sediment metagenome TaxID=412755 RepID=X0V3N7_9ZZZZ